MPELALFEKDYYKRLNFHTKRDKAMISNILDYIEKYENTTIVVICGFFHRFAIINGLIGKQNKVDFELITDLCSIKPIPETR